MANPFGELINDEKLDKMERYKGKPKTQEDRAREAMRVQTGVAYEEARKYVDGQKESYGTGASVQCMIYNATGETLYYVGDYDWYGHLGRTPYPAQIGNGQWASFLYVHSTNEPSGCQAAVKYNGKQKNGDISDFTLAWSTAFSATNAYCEMRAVGQGSSWEDIYDRTNNSDDNDKVDDDGILIEVSIVYEGPSPVFTALLTIPQTIG
ncbi:hypothetical protein vseg_011374 [Gypsophila vaccaria]